MNRPRRSGLDIDDPLGPGPSAHEKPTATQPGTDHTAPADEDKAADRSSDGSMGTARPPVRSKGSRNTVPASERPSAIRHQTTGETGDLAEPDGRPWRDWTGLSGVGSFRLPHELLAELGDTARELQLPIGMIVTAAITQLLDEPPDEIAALVDKADDARIQARGRARRRVTTRSDD
jgi:hypothetical protein